MKGSLILGFTLLKNKNCFRGWPDVRLALLIRGGASKNQVPDRAGAGFFSITALEALVGLGDFLSDDLIDLMCRLTAVTPNGAGNGSLAGGTMGLDDGH